MYINLYSLRLLGLLSIAKDFILNLFYFNYYWELFFAFFFFFSVEEVGGIFIV